MSHIQHLNSSSLSFTDPLGFVYYISTNLTLLLPPVFQVGRRRGKGKSRCSVIRPLTHTLLSFSLFANLWEGLSEHSQAVFSPLHTWYLLNCVLKDVMSDKGEARDVSAFQEPRWNNRQWTITWRQWCTDGGQRCGPLYSGQNEPQ